MFLYVNQVLQAEGIKMAIEAHRTNMPYCMGSLYWQLNDCWPVASWSGIDNFGNWKAMHYFVKNAFNSILVVPDSDSSNHISVSIVSDKLENVGVLLNVSIIDFEGQLLFELKKNITIDANSSNVYFKLNLDSLEIGIDKGQILLNAEVFDINNKLLSSNVLYFTSVKNLNLPKPEITYKINEISGYFIITLRTKGLAKNLYLHGDNLDGKFSVNYFDLLPENSMEVIFTPKQPMNLASFKENLKILTIKDTY
jgi:beta-mannosidase